MHDKECVIDNNSDAGFKITTVTITRIESDIIESFVRHTLSFSDELIVYDNDSHDGTREILNELIEEGLPLTVVNDDGGVEFNHAEIMTRLCKLAVQSGAGLILPFDVDEFLVDTEGTKTLRELLLRLPKDKISVVPLVQYFLDEEYSGDNFILWEKSVREANILNSNNFIPKCLIPAVFVNEGFSLAQGCHFVNMESNILPAIRAGSLHLAHFHYREYNRYCAKSTLGWLGTICKYSENTPVCSYMKTKYRCIYKKEHIKINKGEIEECNLQEFTQCQLIKYNRHKKLSFVQIVMHEAEKLAVAYSEEKILRLGKYVDVIIPYDGDDISLNVSLKSIQEQVYPYVRVLVICLNRNPPLLNMNSYDFFVESVTCYEDYRKSFYRIGGDYVQFLRSGDVVFKKHFISMMAVAELNGYNFRLFIPYFEQPYDENVFFLPRSKENNEYLIYSCQELWQHILIYGNVPANGLKNVLLPKKLILNLGDAFLYYTFKKHLDYMGLWRNMLLADVGNTVVNRQVFFYFHSNMEFVNSPLGNDALLGLLEWFRWLNEDNEMLSEEWLNVALDSWLKRGKRINEISEIDDDVKNIYDNLLKCIRV